MWAPFFDLPCESDRNGQTPASPAASAAVAAGGTPERSSRAAVASAAAPSAATAGAARSRSTSSSGGRGGGGAGELRPGAVKVGVHSDKLEVRGLRIKGGAGRALAGVAAVQDRAYWEVHVKELGSDLTSKLLVGMSMVTMTGADALQQELGQTPRTYAVQFGAGGTAPLKAGDVIGVAYDQAVFPVSVMVWHNGAQLSTPSARALKGEQWPALFLSDCTVDWALGEEHWKSAKSCPTGFTALMPSRGLIGD